MTDNVGACNCRCIRGAALLVVALIAGCGGGGEEPPKVVAVSGIVKLDGQPLKGASILFVPIEAAKGIGAAGTSDGEGKYSLAFGNNRGVLPGGYTVVVEKWVNKDGSDIATGPDIDIEQMKMGGLVKSLLPPAYSDPRGTPLKALIEDKERQTVDLEVQSKK